MKRIEIFLMLGLVGVGIPVSIALVQVSPTWQGAVSQVIGLASACCQAVAAAHRFGRRRNTEEPAAMARGFGQGRATRRARWPALSAFRQYVTQSEWDRTQHRSLASTGGVPSRSCTSKYAMPPVGVWNS
jgi:hypothetical protein